MRARDVRIWALCATYANTPARPSAGRTASLFLVQVDPVKGTGRPRWTAELIDPFLASGKIEEIQSSADLFAFAFLLAGRRMLSIDDALDTLHAHGLPETTPRAELAERLLAGARSDRAFVPYYGTSFTLSRGADIDERVFEAFMGPSARERLAAKQRQAKREAHRRTPTFSKPPPRPRAPDDGLAGARSAEPAPLPRMPPAAAPAPVRLRIAPLVEADVAALWATSARIEVDPPRPGAVGAAAKSFALRNGVARVAQVSIATASYVAVLVEYTIESPEQRRGVRWIIVGPNGADPDDALGLLLDPGEPLASAGAGAGPSEAELVGAARWVARRSAAVLHAAVQPVAQNGAAKQVREHGRIVSELDGRWASAHGANADGVRLEAPESIVAERDALLRGLGDRFAIRVTATATRLLRVSVPAGVVAVRLRRRNIEREVMLHMPAGVERLDRLACEGCGELTARPAGCDGRLHLLCERCAPATEGKIACPACEV